MSGDDLRIILCGLSGVLDIYWATYLGKVYPDLGLTKARFAVSWLCIYFGLALYPSVDAKSWGILYAVLTSLTALTTVAAQLEIHGVRWGHLLIGAVLIAGAFSWPAPSYLALHHQILTALFAFSVILIRRSDSVGLTLTALGLLEFLYYGGAGRQILNAVFPALQFLAKILGYLSLPNSRAGLQVHDEQKQDCCGDHPHRVLRGAEGLDGKESADDDPGKSSGFHRSSRSLSSSILVSKV